VGSFLGELTTLFDFSMGDDDFSLAADLLAAKIKAVSKQF
jgi:hypothetical protein